MPRAACEFKSEDACALKVSEPGPMRRESGDRRIIINSSIRQMRCETEQDDHEVRSRNYDDRSASCHYSPCSRDLAQFLCMCDRRRPMLAGGSFNHQGVLEAETAAVAAERLRRRGEKDTES